MHNSSHDMLAVWVRALTQQYSIQTATTCNFDFSNFDFSKTYMEMPGIEPGAFHMQSERSTAELHPQFRDAWPYTLT